MSDLYRLIYTSRNLLPGDEDAQAATVAGILTLSKRNNARVGVTGALLFNAGSFAQVLEGSRLAVEATFERIQRDPRHSDVSVLQCEPVASRGFPNWSMAFVGRSPRGRALWGEFARRTDFDIGRIEADRLFATLLAIVESEEAAPVAEVSPPPAKGLDVGRLRDALGSRFPEPTPTPAPPGPTEVGAGVLRGALDEERGRTTALRRELDDARIALAAARADVEAAERLRDLWAERARAMAAILSREPDLGRGDEGAARRGTARVGGGHRLSAAPVWSARPRWGKVSLPPSRR